MNGKILLWSMIFSENRYPLFRIMLRARKTRAPIARGHGFGPKNQVCRKVLMPADGMRAVASRNWDSALPLRQLAQTLADDHGNGKVIAMRIQRNHPH